MGNCCSSDSNVQSSPYENFVELNLDNHGGFSNHHPDKSTAKKLNNY